MARLVLAAQVQSIILAYALDNPEKVFDLHDLRMMPSMTKLGAFDHHLQAALTSLHNIKKLVKLPGGKGRCRHSYQLATNARLPQKPVTQPAANEAAPIVALADLKVQVDRQKAELAIEFKGLCIRISVVT